jgi:hypothetical protein
VRLAEFVGDRTSRSVITVEESPTFVGTGAGGQNWMCSKCEALVGRGVPPRFLLDVLIICPQCETVLDSPKRTPGEPIPAKSVILPSRTIELASTFDIAPQTVMVAEAAITKYGQEVGLTVTRASDDPGSALNLDAEGLDRLADTGTHLMGARFEKQLASYERGRQATTPSEQHRHTLGKHNAGISVTPLA